LLNESEVYFIKEMSAPVSTNNVYNLFVCSLYPGGGYIDFSQKFAMQ